LTILPRDWDILLCTSVSSQASDGLVCGFQVIMAHARFSLISQSVEICLTVCLGFSPKDALRLVVSLAWHANDFFSRTSRVSEVSQGRLCGFKYQSDSSAASRKDSHIMGHADSMSSGKSARA